MFSNSSSSSTSWLSSTAPLITLCSPKRRPFYFFSVSFSCKSTPNSIHYDSKNDASSSPTFPDSESYIRRQWIEADPPQASQERFTVVSYNILANRNAMKHRDMYPNVDPLHLRWEHRKRMICKELIGLNPDVICLQEVDKYYDLLKMMENAGYGGSYKRRTGDTADGCAMFWKTDKESIGYKVLGLRDNVAQLSVFKIIGAESRRLLVGNIHVLYSPKRGEIKLGQIRFLLSRAHFLVKKWGDIPVILTGDFNITPQSAIYKFLASSELNIMVYDRTELSGQRNCHPPEVFGHHKEKISLMDGKMDSFSVFKNCWTSEEIKTATGSSECQLLKHPLDLKSSYATIKGSKTTRNVNGEPLATSYHSKFLGTVDYIWYTEGIVPTRVLDTLPFDILRRTGGLPHEKLGSDHLALVSEFAFT